MTEDKRQNEIIRIQKKRNNFVMLDKGFLDDDRLSFKAKGILAYLLSKPDNWKVIVGDLIKHAKDGKKAVYSGLRELKEYGYYKKIPVRDETGRRISHWESVIFECPEEHPELPEESNRETPLLTPCREGKKNALKSTSSLLTPFVYVENVQIQNDDIQNGERNNNYLNNKYTNDNKSKSKSLTVTPTIDSTNTHTTQENPSRKEKEPSVIPTPASQGLNEGTYINNRSYNGQYNTYEELESRVKKNIGYDIFIQERNPHIAQINDIMFNIMEVLSTADPTIKIKQQSKNTEFVKSAFMNLRYNNILYVLERFNNVSYPVVHKGSYIKTLLYTSLEEMESYYQNEYRQGNL